MNIALCCLLAPFSARREFSSVLLVLRHVSAIARKNSHCTSKVSKGLTHSLQLNLPLNNEWL